MEPLGGEISWDDPTTTPRGIANIAKNARFGPSSVSTRYGLQHTMATGADNGDVTGLEVLKVLGVSEEEIPLVYADKGFLLRESPAGSGIMIQLVTPRQLPGPGSMMKTAKAYNRAFLAFTDLRRGLLNPIQFNGRDGLVTPVSQNILGALWAPGTYYYVGDLVRASDGTGRWFRCTSHTVPFPGLAGPEPTWPDLNGYFSGPTWIPATASDPVVGNVGGSVWEEWTPNASVYVPTPVTPDFISNNPGGGAIPAGKDVYFRLSYYFFGQESLWTDVASFDNTSANDQLTLNFQFNGDVPGPPGDPVGGPRMPRWLANWNFNLRVYAAIVDTGDPPPTTYYAQGVVTVGVVPVFDSINTSLAATPPGSPTLLFDSALQKPFEGESGTRYMIMLRKDSVASLSPVDPGSPIPVLFAHGSPRPVATLPPGGNGYTLNVAAFTVAGAKQAGPFNYIAASIPETAVATRILAITRLSGTVTAKLENTGGMAAGEVANIAGVVTAGFAGFFILATVTADSVTWAQSGSDLAGLVAANSRLTIDQILTTTKGALLDDVLELSTAGIFLNFDDDTLANDSDVTSQLTSMPVPPCTDIAYIPSLGKMAYVSDQFPSSLLFSQTDDPGNIDGVGGELQIEPTNGARMICCRELRNGAIVALKENGGYGIAPGDPAPAVWGKARLWDGHGPPNADCVALGPDFLLFGCQDGLYKFDGNPAYCVSQEQILLWKTINWKASQPMWMEVDDEEKTVRIGLALDGADTPSKVLLLDYFKGWEPTIEKGIRGDLITNQSARRWSLHDIEARIGKVVKRTLVTPIDSRIDQRQFLFGHKSTGSLIVDMIQPDEYDDNGEAIDFQYLPAFTSGNGMVLAFGGITGRVKGLGSMELTPVTEDASFGLPTHVIDLGNDLKIKHFGVGVRARNEHLTYLVTNGNQVGAWVEILELAIWFREIFTSRR